MTVTLYLNKITLLRDLQTLKTIFEDDEPEMIEEMRGHLHPLNISSEPFTRNNVVINVTMEEFALIGIFNESL